MYYGAVLAIARNRARMRGEPLPDEVTGLGWTHQISSLSEIHKSQPRARPRAPDSRAVETSMKTIARRLHRLEEQLGTEYGKPRHRVRLIVESAGVSHPDLEEATCRRALLPNGILFESLEFGDRRGRELTDAELEHWIDGFPIVAT